jgi:hypothetical protein
MLTTAPVRDEVAAILGFQHMACCKPLVCRRRNLGISGKGHAECGSHSSLPSWRWSGTSKRNLTALQTASSAHCPPIRLVRRCLIEIADTFGLSMTANGEVSGRRVAGCCSSTRATSQRRASIAIARPKRLLAHIMPVWQRGGLPLRFRPAHSRAAQPRRSPDERDCLSARQTHQ